MRRRGRVAAVRTAGSLSPALALVLALVLALATGCSAPAAEDGATRTVTVLAAASLADSFEEIAEEFEARHGDVEVVLDVAGSSTLVAQVEQGARADVIASADGVQMQRLVTAGLLAGPPVDFASNTLQIVVPAGNPAGVRTFADLTRPELAVVLCAPQVPCGTAAARAEAAAGVDVRPVSEEQSVADVLTKVQAGEADAGLVYVTDVRRGGDDVEGIDFPAAAEAVNTCPVAALAEAREPDLAAEFVDLVTSAAGRRVLDEAGFGRP